MFRTLHPTSFRTACIVVVCENTDAREDVENMVAKLCAWILQSLQNNENLAVLHRVVESITKSSREYGGGLLAGNDRGKRQDLVVVICAPI
jgi:hypothetical protein